MRGERDSLYGQWVQAKGRDESRPYIEIIVFRWIAARLTPVAPIYAAILFPL